MRSGFFLLVLLAVFSGCQMLSTAPEVSRVHLVVEGTTFALDRGGHGYVVPWVVENQGSETAYLSRCGDRLSFELERWENTAWVNASAAICPAIYSMVPLPLAPGQALRGVGQISTPGRYRLRLGVSERADVELRWVLVSEPFTIQ
ncbi:hypothetical protein BH24GEM2_BH24GEM2_12200 [soil metagenome]